MTNIGAAPWPRRVIAPEEFQVLYAAKMAGLPCWQVGKVLGSMLHFDFGSKILVPGLRDRSAEIGLATVHVNDCSWKIYFGAVLVSDSDSITDAQGRELHQFFVGSTLKKIDFFRDPDVVDLVFSNGACVSIDLTNANQTDDPILDIVVSSGEIFQMAPSGQLYLADFISTIRFGKTV